MRIVRLFPVAVLLAAAGLAGCQWVARPVAANASPYVCPDGRQVRAGLTADGSVLLLSLDGRTHTLRRRGPGEGYGNGYYTARPDDLFLHLAIPGTLLPQRCRLLAGPSAAAP